MPLQSSWSLSDSSAESEWLAGMLLQAANMQSSGALSSQALLMQSPPGRPLALMPDITVSSRSTAQQPAQEGDCRMWPSLLSPMDLLACVKSVCVNCL